MHILILSPPLVLFYANYSILSIAFCVSSSPTWSYMLEIFISSRGSSSFCFTASRVPLCGCISVSNLSFLQLGCLLKQCWGASLLVQWLRICLPMQRTWVQALVQEDPTCHGATKPVRHNYWAYALELTSHNYWACVPQLMKPGHL